MVQANPTGQGAEEVDFAELFAKLVGQFKKMAVQTGEDERLAEEEKADVGPVVVGKALSERHARAMARHAVIQPVMTKAQRQKAVGTVQDFPNDAMVTYMTKYSEEIFEPKRILSSGDWLKSQREPDQYYQSYKEGKLNIKWVNETRNKIHLFACDNSFTDAQLAAYKKYANAFFTGIKAVEIMRRGQPLSGQPANARVPRKAPRDFLNDEIESRESYDGKQYRCCGKTGILMKLPAHRPADSYSCLCITMQDLYPGPKWGFCFGWASYTEGVGGFSFKRFDPAWDGITDPNAEKNLLMRACAIMCHEIGHQFGLRHCIYYECLMNGIMSA